jgi:3-methyladenine DNA glycosylase AlkD
LNQPLARHLDAAFIPCVPKPESPATLKSLRAALRATANPAKARFLAGFFKTGPGDYAEGDVFWGITVPTQRRIAREYRSVPLRDLERLLHSPVHEERLAALLILSDRFERAGEPEQRKIHTIYLRNLKHVNNWDLVDLSAPRILGAWLLNRDRAILKRLTRSKNLWERRVAMIATQAFIYNGESADTVAIAGLLLRDEHDLIHKAVGWMLREVGKRVDIEVLRRFLRRHAHEMPRTALRYAIERLPASERRRWMAR